MVVPSEKISRLSPSFKTWMAIIFGDPYEPHYTGRRGTSEEMQKIADDLLAAAYAPDGRSFGKNQQIVPLLQNLDGGADGADVVVPPADGERPHLFQQPAPPRKCRKSPTTCWRRLMPWAGRPWEGSPDR